MNKEKISSQEIIDLVASKASVSKRAAEEFLKVMIASVEEGLLAGEVVKIKSFGTFKLQWNEPRKSVNVQTGTEIMIKGFYKVVFIPDTALKEQINEPFAHLEPVVLNVESQKKELVDENEVDSDPLSLFSEQASEIKSLISEIQALSVNSKPEISLERTAQKNMEDEKIEEIVQKEQTLEDINKEDKLSLIEDEKSLVIENKEDNDAIIDKDVEIIDNVAEIIDNSAEIKPNKSVKVEKKKVSVIPATSYLDELKSPKKRKVWIWVSIPILLITGLLSGLYFFYPPANEFSNKTIANYKYTVNDLAENMSISEIINSVSKWFSPDIKQITPVVAVAKLTDSIDSDSIKQNQSIDSLQLLFDNPRVYKDFIASERIKAGSRLTIMSKRYFGTKDFWVYIYEANKDKISNPDNISVGTLIRIPKLDPRLVDTTNPRCIKKAMELHDIYLK